MTEAKSKKKAKSMADHMLEQARDDQFTASLYLANGFQLKGHVVGFDHESILFSHKNARQLVMRSGIASMYPLTRTKDGANGLWQAEVPSGSDD